MSDRVLAVQTVTTPMIASIVLVRHNEDAATIQDSILPLVHIFMRYLQNTDLDTVLKTWSGTLLARGGDDDPQAEESVQTTALSMYQAFCKV